MRVWQVSIKSKLQVMDLVSVSPAAGRLCGRACAAPTRGHRWPRRGLNPWFGVVAPSMLQQDYVASMFVILVNKIGLTQQNSFD